MPKSGWVDFHTYKQRKTAEWSNNTKLLYLGLVTTQTNYGRLQARTKTTHCHVRNKYAHFLKQKS